MTDYRSRSFWLDDVPGDLVPRPALAGPIEVDIAIVGAGFTGLLWLSTSPAQTPRLKAVVAEQQAMGFGDDDWTWLGRAEVRRRLLVEGCRGAVFSPHYASVQPARLARGLAERAEALGVALYEGTPALTVRAGAVETPAGTVAARSVVLATEAYTVDLPGHERDVVPIYDFMIATAPLSDDAWDEIGGRAARLWPTGATCSSTRSVPPTGVWRSAARRRPTTTARASTSASSVPGRSSNASTAPSSRSCRRPRRRR